MPTDTFGIAANGNDGYVWRDDAAYPPAGVTQHDTAGTSIIVERGLGAAYFVYNGKLKWDTSSIPDGANITSATLRIFVIPAGVGNPNSLSLTADWYVFDGTSSDFSHNPLTTAHSGTALSAVTQNASNDFALTNLSNISTTGTTGIRLHITQRASDAAPTGENYVQFAAREHATYVEPQLIVTYTAAVGGDLVGQVAI